MIFFTIPSGDSGVRQALDEGRIAMMDTPSQSQAPRNGLIWAADNGCYSDRWDRDKWWRWLLRRVPYADTCVFATAPDVVGDAAATLELSMQWMSKIRELGFPVAFVAQDGVAGTEVPWDEFDVLFIGGTNEFKFTPESLAVIREAKRRGKHVHIGRINSLKRWRRAEAYGADSCDGTFLKFGPAINLLRLNNWHRDLHERPAMFQLSGEE